MESTFKVILMVLVAAFYSCKNEDVLGTSSSITSNGVLSGTIMNYPFAESDSIKVEYFSFAGGFSVTTDGKFSASLSIPYLRRFGSIKGVNVSDTTTLIGNTIFCSYKKDTKSVELLKCNFTTDSIKTAGMSFSDFIYVNKAFTVKGTQIETINYGIYSKNETYVYNLKFKKGWNEIVEKVNFYSSTGSIITEKVSFSNTITLDLQWKYLPNYLIVNNKVKGINGIKSGKLYREQ